ncbi:MAG: hypothetical protein A2170_14180 [Deltaproteobacteria bacterium RBG_13_53_10]|nr:MAG: hypothetical protein A2170_14180 [Deltaproteobacteria bacterium RBG_13_53_10]
MTDPRLFFFLPDNGGRRLGIDRRRFSYSAHIPERRQGFDRRGGQDRRQMMSARERRARKRVSGSWGKMERRIALKRPPAAARSY